jgi:hypothetical protein
MGASPPRKSAPTVMKDESILSRIEDGLEHVLGVDAHDEKRNKPSPEGGSLWGSPLSSHWASADAAPAPAPEPLVAVLPVAEAESDAVNVTSRSKTVATVSSGGFGGLELALVFGVMISIMTGAFFLYGNVRKAQMVNISHVSATENFSTVSEKLPNLIGKQVSLALSGSADPSSLNLGIDPSLVYGVNIRGSGSSDSEFPTVSSPILFVSSGGNPVVRDRDGSYTVEVDIAYPDVALSRKELSKDDELPARWFADSSRYEAGAKVLEQNKASILASLAAVPSATCVYTSTAAVRPPVGHGPGLSPSNVAQQYSYLELKLNYQEDCPLK